MFGGEKGAGLRLRVEGVGVRTRLEGFVESCCGVPTYIRVYHMCIGFQIKILWADQNGSHRNTHTAGDLLWTWLSGESPIAVF